MQRRRFLAGVGSLLGIPVPCFANVEAQHVFYDEDFRSLPQESCDVLVVGGGAGGLAAAVSAAEAGAGRVVLIEKNPRLGGDSLISGGYFNAVVPERQIPLGIVDSVEFFEEQILQSGDGRNDPAVVRTLAAGAGPALRWLEEKGMTFLPQVDEIFGSGWRRCFRPILSRGQSYIRALSAAAYSAGVTVRTKTPALRLVKEGAVLAGAVAKTETGKLVFIRAKRGVVLASGGFAANSSLVRRYAPTAAEMPVDSQPGNTGEMIEAAHAIGAALVNMDAVECVPGSRAGINYPIRLDYIPSRMIMIDDNGRRFVNEESPRAVVADAILRYGNSPCWAVADAATLAALDGISQKNIYRGLYAGEAYREDTPEKLAEALGLDEATFLETLRSEPAASRIRTFPLWAVRMYLRLHATLGGIRINAKAAVLDASGNTIERLWACGSCTGSVHGRSRMGGNGLNTAVVFGRLAGKAAAKSPRI